MLRIDAADELGELAGRLSDVLSEPLADPLTPEWIVVVSAGMQRWLSLELSRHLGTSGPQAGDGVAANIEFLFPGGLTRRVVHPGADRGSDPWELDRMVWAVLDVLDSATAGKGDPGLGPLHRLAPGVTDWGRARRLADLFDRYIAHRPDMIRAWANGRDVDGVGQPIPQRISWQPHLWRLVRDRIGFPSPPELMPRRLAALRAGECPDEVPERISLFGLSTIAGGAPFLDLLDALATQREVHLMLHQTSAALTTRVRETVDALGQSLDTRAKDPSVAVAENPLLRSWARPAREGLALLGDRLDAMPLGIPGADESAGDTREPITLLSRVQADLRADLAPVGDFIPAADDHSIQIHSCHGDTRQVEVLRDQILHLLADDPTLSEDDIIVLSPALDGFAPLIESVLGPAAGTMDSADQGEGPPSLRYRVSDRSLRSSYPLLAALGALVELLASRFSDAAVLDFANLTPVRQRFDLDDEALATLADWVDKANTRWGLDGVHREQWGIPPEYEAGSWRNALDRLLLGIAVSDDMTALAPTGILPIAAEGDDVPVAGRFAELLGRLSRLCTEVSKARPANEWITLLQTATEDLFATDSQMQWQEHRLSNVLSTIAENATQDGRPSEVNLTLSDVRHLLGDQLEGSAGSADFFRGGVTFSTLTPLRGIPHRVICLLGMDEAAFSAAAADGDDLLAIDPFVGDRDRRADARQALLDTILAAKEHLIVLRNGHSVVTNQPVPAAVALAELRDVVAGTVHPDFRKAFLDRLTIVHPRQRFDERNFLDRNSPSKDSNRTGPWSFDPLACAGAAARRANVEPAPFLSGRLPEHDESVISLADLREFLIHPTKYFLRRNLEIAVPKAPSRSDGKLVEPSPGSSGIPRSADGRDLLLDLGNLENWGVKNRLLEHLRAGGDRDSFLRRERAGGLLPPGRLAHDKLDAAAEKVEPLVTALENLGGLQSPSDHLAVDITLPSGTRLVGTVRNDGGLRPGPIELSVSKRKDAHKLIAWLDVMALTAQDPVPDWQAVHICPATNRAGASGKEFSIDLPEAAPRQKRATESLELVIDLFRRGQREPLPIFANLSWALYKGNNPAGKWNNDFAPADGTDEWNQLAFNHATLEGITSMALLDDDPDGPGDDRATRYADYLWGEVEATAPGAGIKL